MERASGMRLVPKGGDSKEAFTPKAVRLFAAMLECECDCAPIVWGGKYWERTQCAGCEEWWRLHSLLHKELGAKLWEWPCIQHPEAVTCFPEGSTAAKTWKPDLRAPARWRALGAALGKLG